MKRCFLGIIATGVTAAFGLSVAAAQPPDGAGQGGGDANGWTVDVGGGIRFAPSYVGDDDYQLFLLPNIRVAYGDRLTLGVPDGLRYAVIKTDKLHVGPNIRPSFGRNEDGRQPFAVAGAENDDLLGLGDIDTSVEVGGYARYQFSRTTALSATVVKALGGHDGVVADMSLRYRNRAMLGRKPVFYSFGPSVRFVDQTFHQSFFGVTAAQSAASGLAAYAPKGGLNSYSLSASAVYPLSKRVSATMIAGYDRLTEEAAASSLVRERGARDQASAGVFITYRFGGR